MRTLDLLILLPLLATAALADAPLRLTNGEPLVCMYTFTHWWEPWKSSDDALRADFQRLRAMGVNTLLIDHEWSQAIDGNWKLLDRGHRLAKECGLRIVPWLSLKSWSDISPGGRAELAKQWFGVDIRYGLTQDGKAAAPLIYDGSVLTAGAKYAEMYLDRYLDQALLRLRWNGAERPVISLSVESAWEGSFDETTNLMFCRWLRARYADIAALNQAWGTTYGGFFEVDPTDKAIFDYAASGSGKAAHQQAVEDHVEFRSETISDSLARMAAMVRRKHPDVLIMAEVPYQYGSRHPHAMGYRVGYGATPSSCRYADIVLFRNTGPIDEAEAKVVRAEQALTGQKFILTYRTYSDWDVQPDDPKFAQSVELYAKQGAELASGFGFYSFNEMVDTHLAFSAQVEANGWTAERAERAIGLAGAMIRRYREIAGPQ
ncbi:MAG: beta-galactosidase [Armatimonadetes bacterium]|nr:beta-galactosidase [Armatimonadota bacterium]